MSRPFRPSLLLAASLAAGCATASRPTPEVTQRAQEASSYSAHLRVSVKGPSGRGRTPVLLAFQRPESLRIEIPGPTGARLIAVARGETLTAVFPAHRAVFAGRASAADLDALLGVGLTPREVMDLLVGSGSPRLRAYQARWGPTLPRQIDATLPDGGRLKVKVADAETGVELPAAAFVDPAHAGYRSVDADEARRLWQRR